MQKTLQEMKEWRDARLTQLTDKKAALSVLETECKTLEDEVARLNTWISGLINTPREIILEDAAGSIPVDDSSKTDIAAIIKETLKKHSGEWLGATQIAQLAEAEGIWEPKCKSPVASVAPRLYKLIEDKVPWLIKSEGQGPPKYKWVGK